MDYAKMITEQVNPDTADIDLCSTEEILELIHKEDCKVALAVGKVLPQIAQAVEAAVQGMTDLCGRGDQRQTGDIGCLRMPANLWDRARPGGGGHCRR